MRSKKGPRHRRWAMKLLALLLSVVFSLGLSEGVLRLFRDPNRFYPYHPNSVRVFYPSEKITPGISGTSYFTTNSFGTRGPEPDGQRVRILTIGGSTTACSVLDDSETWPHLLMQYLNENARDNKFVWVTNSGIDGLNSEHHVMHAKYLLPKIPDLDYAIIYAGLNDVGMWLYQKHFDPHELDQPDVWNERIAESFRDSNFTPSTAPWYKHLELWKRASILKAYFATLRAKSMRKSGAIVQDAQLHWLEEERKRRQNRQKGFVPRAKMDTLPAALDSYGRNLQMIIDYSRQQKVEPIFMAQAIEHQLLGEEARKRLWMGAMDGGKTYVREEEMLTLVDKYNDRMKAVAEKNHVLFIDLPHLLDGQANIFYDLCHFNEKGARVAARAIADFLDDHLFAKDHQH